MAVQFLTGLNVNGNININTNQLQNVVIQPLAADPAGIDGRIYYNSGTNKLKIYNGTDWVAFQTGTDGDTTYELFGVGSTNGTAGIQLDGSDGSIDDVLIVGAGTTTVTRSGNTLTVTSNDSKVGTVTSVATTHGGNAFTASIGNVATVNPSVDIAMAGNATQYVNGAGNLVLLSTIPQGDVTEVQGGTYITVTDEAGPIPIVNHDATSRTDTTSTASPASGATFTAVDGVSSNATGHLTALNVKTITLPTSDNYVSWELDAESGTPQQIESGDTVTFTGGTKITTAVAATDVLTITHDATSRTDTTSTVSANVFPVVNSVSTDATGHVTAIDIKTVTVPDNNDNTTYTLPVSAGGSNSAIVTLDGSSGTDSTVTFEGTTDEIAVTETIVSGTEGTIKIGLPDDVTIANDLTVTGVIIQNEVSTGFPLTPLNVFAGQVQVPTATAPGNAPNLQQVSLLIAGIGVFQGAYNASTNSPPLSGASNVGLTTGDYFVVSTAGNSGGFFPDLEPGDFIFADQTIMNNSSPAITAYTVVQADANIAGSGATDGNTEKGVSGFDSANFTVSSNGWVQLNNQSITVATYGSASKTVALAINADGITTTAAEQDIAITASQVTDFCTVVDTCMGSNSVTTNIGNGTLVAYPITHNFNTRNVVVTCFRNSTPWDTVVLDVERTSVNQVTLKSTTALTTNQVSVIITKVV